MQGSRQKAAGRRGLSLRYSCVRMAGEEKKFCDGGTEEPSPATPSGAQTTRLTKRGWGGLKH